MGTAPENYRASPEIQRNLEMLREYLRREGPSQVLINRVMLLWASTKIPGLLTATQQKSIMDEALGKQQADGGFSLSSFVGAWKRADGTPLETRSDGYATGIVSLVLEQAGVAREQPALKRGLAWLAANQSHAEGRWLARQVPQAKFVATKGYTGHTLGAAGALEAVISILCLQKGLLPKTLGFSQLDPEIGIAPTKTLESGNFKTALSLSLGFGRLNAALALGRSQ